jgi:hypothetical protein
VGPDARVSGVQWEERQPVQLGEEPASQVGLQSASMGNRKAPFKQGIDRHASWERGTFG